MRTMSPWIRRGIVLAAVIALLTLVFRQGRGSGPHNQLLPAIGGDTWPPVPVKGVRPT
jgi:hypothetical protein